VTVTFFFFSRELFRDLITQEPAQAGEEERFRRRAGLLAVGDAVAPGAVKMI